MTAAGMPGLAQVAGAVRNVFDRRQRGRLLLLWIATLVAAALEMVGIGAIPAFVALITDPGRLMAMLPGETLPRLVAETDTATLTLVGAGVLTGAFLLKNIYVAALVFVENRMLRDHTVVLSDRLFRAYLYSPYIFHLGTNSAHLVRNIGTEVTTAVQTIRSAMLALREGLVLVVMFLLLLLIDPLISLSVFLVLTAAAAGFYIAVRRRLAARGRLAQEHRARQVQVINQAFGAIKDVKILGRESYLAAVLDRETAGKEHHEFFQRVIGAFPRLFLEVVGIGSVLLVAAMFVVLGRSASTMLPVLTLLAVAVVRMVPAFNAITTSLAGMRFSWPSFELVARELERLPPPPPSADGTAAVRAPFTAVLSMHDVGFAYPGSDSPVLRGIDLEIRRGEVVAFIGPSGSGKTTLVNLLMGLLTPTVGRIRMDGRDVAEGGAGWRRQVGYIPQDLYLLDDSVRRNIAFGLPDGEIDDAAVAGAVRAAQIEDLVAALPQGLDTFIGERGARLSGGQRQRIAIARALYHDPPVLVLDEATAALDSETEGAVIDAINRLRGDRTIIIIAHRMSTVARCDRVYLLRDGQIVDAGTFAELRRRHPHVESDALADVAGDGTPPERVEIT